MLAATLVGVASVLPLLMRRRRPFLALAIITAANVLAPVDGPFTIPHESGLITPG